MALLFISLAIRLSALGRYVTPDELIWVYRSVLFREALLNRSWANTLVAGHPGVITTWLGSIGIGFQLMFNPADHGVYQWITHLAWLTPDNTIAFQKLNHFLSFGRLFIAIVNSVGLVAVFYLARRLLNSILAFLFAFLMAVDPFYAGLSGLLHVDGLLTTFVTISLLSIALAMGFGRRDEKWRSRVIFAALSGGAAALAVLSKTPALLLVPLTGAILILFLWQNRKNQFWNNFKQGFFLGVVWLGCFLFLVFLLFPALWTTTREVFMLAGGNANRHLEEALRETFFLGKIAFDHGPLFYPIAIIWRIGPVVSVGLILLAAWIIKRRGKESNYLSIVVIFALWAVLFTALITITAKKFDRYALPVFPALTVLAVIGWGYWLKHNNRWARVLLLSLIGLQVITTLFVLPFPLMAYNPLVGGPLTAPLVMPIGWGESVSRSGYWLSGKNDSSTRTAVSGIAPSLAPFFSGKTIYVEDEADSLQADYIVFTANSRQIDAKGVEQATAQLDLLQIIHFGGLDQAWIYSNPHPVTDDIKTVDLGDPISFDNKINLLSQDLHTANGNVLFTARWERLVADGRFRIKLKLLDANNHTWSELETYLLNEVYFYPENWESGHTPTISYKLDIPATIPPGDYHVELSLIEDETGAQMPVMDDGSFLGVVYDAGFIQIDEPGTTSTKEINEDTTIYAASWLSDTLRMLGYSISPNRIVSGANLSLDIFWQAEEKLPGGMQIAIQIANEEPVILPLSRFDSGEWYPERILQEKYRLPVPAELPSGPATVKIWPVLANGQALDGTVDLAEVYVDSPDRLFSLPDNIALPLSFNFEPGIELRGADRNITSSTSGEGLPLTLYWQVENKTDQPVTAFVHLVNQDGDIVAQIDRWPGGLPSNIWASGQVIVDKYELPIPQNVQPGEYQIAVGLYYASNGYRLPLTDQDGNRLPDDRVILPIPVEIRP